MHDPWPAFVASLNPDALEAERFRMPSLDELPGSAASRREQRIHEQRIFDYRNPPPTVRSMRAALAESWSWKARQGSPARPTDEQMAIAKAVVEYKKSRSK